MSKGIKRKLRKVREGIEVQLQAEYSHLGNTGRGLQREGFVGGYLQALADVDAASRGFLNNNSRFANLWKDTP